jgi:hypothetical protein
MAAGDRIFMAKESTSQEILSNTKKIIEDAKAKPKRYGMRINLLDSNPATRVKYLYDAVGMTPAGMNFAGGGFDYGDWGDIWFVKKNRPVMVRTDGTVDYELNHENHALKLNGGASDITNFNSQPHKEADQRVKPYVNVKKLFQLTASQGG